MAIRGDCSVDLGEEQRAVERDQAHAPIGRHPSRRVPLRPAASTGEVHVGVCCRTNTMARHHQDLRERRAGETNEVVGLELDLRVRADRR
jgi:hypothetical protein